MYDTLVIGGGAVGMFTALEFAKHGERVLLLEAGELGGQASWAGGGILSPLSPWLEDADLLQLADYSQSLYPDLAREILTTTGIDPEYLPSGYLILNPGEEADWQEWADRTHAERVKNTRHFHESICNTGDTALFLPWVGQIRNPRLIKALKSMLKHHGVTVLEHTPVTGWNTAQDKLTSVTTANASYQAERFIACAGAWLNEMDSQCNEFRIKPIRGQMLLTHAPNIGLQHIIIQDGCYLIPRKDGHILIGSTVEDVGFDTQTTQSAAEYLFSKATEMMPQIADHHVIRQWAGLRPRCESSKPVIGPSRHFENVFYNVGHFRIGLTLAPASAELLWQQIHQAQTFMSPAAFQINGKTER